MPLILFTFFYVNKNFIFPIFKYFSFFKKYWMEQTLLLILYQLEFRYIFTNFVFLLYIFNYEFNLLPVLFNFLSFMELLSKLCKKKLKSNMWISFVTNNHNFQRFSTDAKQEIKKNTVAYALDKVDEERST